MMFVIQTYDKPNKIYIVKAESRLQAIGKAGLVDIPKRIWCLENCQTDTIVEDLHIVELD